MREWLEALWPIALVAVATAAACIGIPCYLAWAASR